MQHVPVDSAEANPSNVDQTQADLNFFKSVVVGEENMEEIKLKLRSTVEARTKLMNDAKKDFLEQYPMFFTHPTLVISIVNCFLFLHIFIKLIPFRFWRILRFGFQTKQM